MTAHPIDTEALAKRAGHILFTDGPEQPAATAHEVCVFLDQLAAAEHRATRAETRVKAVEDVLDKVEARQPWLRPVDFAGKPFSPSVDITDIRRALDGEA